jgi:hypothetical protein
MNSVVSASLAAFALALVACAAPTSDDSAAASADLDATVKPGTFRLYSDAHHVANPECDSYTDLTLSADKASLIDGLGGKCALTAKPNPNPRSFALHVSDGGCGIKVYEGSRRVPAGPSADAFASIKIRDYRNMVCKIAIQASIIVEETDPGFPGAITRTMYAADTQAAAADRLTISCHADNGTAVQFFTSVPAGELVHADYTALTNGTSSLVATMDSCSVVSKPGPFVADGATVTECHQHIMDGGFAVKLTTGGFTGIPSAELLKVTLAGEEPVASLNCQYTP